MYVDHFKFSALAFQRASEPDQFFRSDGLETTLCALHEGIRSDCGLMLLTGETGVGKTAVVQLLEHELRGQIQFIAFDRRLFDVEETETDGEQDEASTVDGIEDRVFHRLVEASRQRPDSSAPVLAVIDDAHTCSTVDLLGLLWAAARLRAGANGTDRPKMLLVGDTELAQRFRVAPLRRLERDLGLQCRMDPLPPRLVDGYIRFHLQRAGYRSRTLFSDAAIAHVEQYSRGIPQLINNICGMALVIAAEDDVHQVTEDIVRDAASDLLVPRETLESAAPITSQSLDEAPASATERDTNHVGVPRPFENLGLWQTPNSAAPITSQSFDEAPASATERDTNHVDAPQPVENLSLWLDEAPSDLFAKGTRDENVNSRALEPVGRWLCSIATRAWLEVERIRQRLEPRFQSARGAIHRRLRKPWRDARVEQRWRSFSIWFGHRSEHTVTVLSRGYERLARIGNSLWIRLKNLWEKARPDIEAEQPQRSTSIGAWMTKQSFLKFWECGVPVAFSSVMAILAIGVWALVLTHDSSKTPKGKRGTNEVVAAGAERSMTPLKTMPAREKVAQRQFASMALATEPYVHASTETGAVIDAEIAGDYQVVALNTPQTWSDKRAEALPRESDSKEVDELENGGTTNASAADPEHAAAAPPEDAKPERSMVEVSMTSKTANPFDTSRAPFLSATNSESRMTAKAVAEPGAVSKASDDRHNADSDTQETRPNPDNQPPTQIHVVASGDTLWSISRRHNTTIDRLRSINGLSEKHVIQPGQSLQVASAIVQGQGSEAWHTVRRGENLYRIGQRYGISLTQIKALNSLSDPSQLKVGQRLRVGTVAPAKQPTSEKRAATQAARQG